MGKKFDKLTDEQKTMICNLSNNLYRPIKEGKVNICGYNTLYELYKSPSYNKQRIYYDIHKVLRQFKQYDDTFLLGNSSMFTISTILRDSNGKAFAKCKITPTYLIIDIL